jgi:hypothetical protein
MICDFLSFAASHPNSTHRSLSSLQLSTDKEKSERKERKINDFWHFSGGRRLIDPFFFALYTAYFWFD